MPIADIVFEGSNDFVLAFPVGTPGGKPLAVSFDGLNIKAEATIGGGGGGVVNFAFIG